MVRRAASVVSPFYFILLALDGIKKNTQGTLNQERNTRNSESRKIHKEFWIKKDTLQWLLKQGRYTRNSESRRKHKELWIKEQTSGQEPWITKDIPGILNQERLTWNPESKKIYQEPRIKTDTLGSRNPESKKDFWFNSDASGQSGRGTQLFSILTFILCCTKANRF